MTRPTNTRKIYIIQRIDSAVPKWHLTFEGHPRHSASVVVWPKCLKAIHKYYFKTAQCPCLLPSRWNVYRMFIVFTPLAFDNSFLLECPIENRTAAKNI